MVSKTIAVSITEEQAKWLKDSGASPSTLIQDAIKQKMNTEPIEVVAKRLIEESLTFKNLVEGIKQSARSK